MQVATFGPRISAQEHLVGGGQKHYSIRQRNGRRLPRPRPVNGPDQGIKINTRL